jgi:p-aminobenzoyl-glutamate transporter AbgT
LIQIKAVLVPPGILSPEKEKAMPFDTAIVVSLITGAFLVFAVALAYGQVATSNLKRNAKPVAQVDEQPAFRKAA